MPRLSRYSAITATPLFTFPCWPPSVQWPMTIAVLLAWREIAPWSFFLAKTSFPSSSRKNWYFVPSAWTPLDMNAVKSLFLKHLAMLAPSWPCNWGNKKRRNKTKRLQNYPRWSHMPPSPKSRRSTYIILFKHTHVHMQRHYWKTKTSKACKSYFLVIGTFIELLTVMI